MKIDNIECEILCDNEPLMEYQEEFKLRLDSDPEDSCKKAKSCYIVSEVGKRFMARIKSDPHLFDVSFHLWVDGQRVQRMCVESDQSYKMEGLLVGPFQRRPYVFSSITTTGGNRVSKESLSAAQDIGSICMKVYRVKNPVSHTESLKLKVDMENRFVHERAKKTGAHRVALGDIETAETTHFLSATYIDPLDSPYRMFIWRYRPKAVLQAQGIILPDSLPLTPVLPLVTVPTIDPAPTTPTPPSSTRRASSPAASSIVPKQPSLYQEDPQQWPTSESQARTKTTDTIQRLQTRLDALKAQRAAFEAFEAALDVQETALKEELRQVETQGLKR